MKTIEEIKTDRTYYHREVNASGFVERIPYTVKVKRDVVIVTPLVRLGYFLLDLVFFYILYLLIATVIMALSYLITNDNSVARTIVENNNLISYSLFFLYYTLTEFALGGTFGKLICGYVVIDPYANKITFGKALLRTVIRYVPFEAFSCILNERGWHDRWSKTYVVKKKEKHELRKLLKTAHDDQDILD